MMIRSLFSVLVLGMFSMVAFASGGSATPPTPTPDTTLPLPVNTSWNLTGGVQFAGIGQGAFDGGDGVINIQKIGGGESVLELGASGSLCGLNCQDGSFNFTGRAFEAVQVDGTVTGNGAGVPVVMQNGGQTLVGVTFNFEKTSASPPSQ